MLTACSAADDRQADRYEIGYTDFLAHADNGDVEEVTFGKGQLGQDLIFWKSDQAYCSETVSEENCNKSNESGNSFEYIVVVPPHEEAYARIHDKGIKTTVRRVSQDDTFLYMIGVAILLCVLSMGGLAS